MSSLNSSGVISGPPVAAFASRAITTAPDRLVMPWSLRSLSISALRISRVAASRKPIIVSRGHCASGRVQLMPGVSASSGKIDAMAPASQGSGSRPVTRNASSLSMSSTIACSARVEIQPNKTAAISHPHSMSPSRPIGVPAGMTPSLMTLRQPSIAARVACRCQASSIAAAEGWPKPALALTLVVLMTPTPVC
jgi:hypothetical protein